MKGQEPSRVGGAAACLWQLGRVLAGAARNWSADRCASMSAALAFYAAFSLAPSLVIVIAVAGFFFGADAVRGLLFAETRSVMGPEGARAIQAILSSAWKSGHGTFASLISLGGMALGASATFSELSSALKRIWHAETHASGVTELLRVRLVSFGLVVGIGFLMVVLLIADTAIVYATDFLFGGDLIHALLDPLQQGLSFVFLCLAFSLLLKILPECPVEARVAGAGGIFAAGLFSLGKRLFALYLAHASTTNVFGAASSLAVLMMWLFFSAGVFLLGAEFAAQLGRQRASGLCRPGDDARDRARPPPGDPATAGAPHDDFADAFQPPSSIDLATSASLSCFCSIDISSLRRINSCSRAWISSCRDLAGLLYVLPKPHPVFPPPTGKNYRGAGKTCIGRKPGPASVRGRRHRPGRSDRLGPWRGPERVPGKAGRARRLANRGTQHARNSCRITGHALGRSPGQRHGKQRR